MPATEALAIQ